MNKFLLSFLLIVLACQLSIAQKKKAWVKAADEAFTIEQDFYKAFRYYESALKYKKEADQYRLLFRQAESARLIGAAEDARAAYQKLLAEAPKDTLAKAPYSGIYASLGTVQLSLAYTEDDFSTDGYNTAGKSFGQYDNNAYKGTASAETIAKGMAVINFANEDQERFANESITLDTNYWDPNFPDYSNPVWPWIDEETINSKRSKRFYPQFYLAGNDGSYYASTSETLPSCMTSYIRETAFSQANQRVYFTRCERETKSSPERCDIFYQNLDSQGLPSGEIQDIPELRTDAASLIQIQPSLSWDEVNEREIIYFVSNRSGGRGGMDIWRSEYDQANGRFSTPINETSVNTPGDEMTPFFQKEVLYFSSNGSSDRYGGFDIFQWNRQWDEVQNLGQKINSSGDDFGYSRNDGGDRAFFISNRGSISNTTEEIANQCSVPDLLGCCCLTTYSFKTPTCPLEVVTLSHCNCPSGEDCQPLTGPSVMLYDITDGPYDSAKKGVKVPAVEENKYVLEDALHPGRKYQLVGLYENGETTLESFGKILDFTNGKAPCAGGAPEMDSLRFECEHPYLMVEVSEQDNGLPLTNARVQILDITEPEGAVPSAMDQRQNAGDPCDKSSVLDTSLSRAKDIQAFTREQVKFERTYLIVVSSDRSDLLPQRDTVTLSKADAAFCGLDCEKKIQILLESKSTAQVPGIQFFFDNARPRWQGWPNRNRNQDIAIQSYIEALADYKGLQNRYARNFTSGSPEDNTQKLELETFFTNELTQSEQKVNTFVEEVKKLLCQGIPVTIQAKGCTSPKFKLPGEVVQVNFNNHLENRRVESVKRDLERLGLNQEDWGELYEFKQIYETCSQLRSNIDIKDLQDQSKPKYSVFSIDAAVARRVEVEVVLGSQ